MREETPLFYDESLERWFVTRHGDVRACLRDRRLGRNFRHVGSQDEFAAAEPLDPRWHAFWDSERWSLLWLEPPEHTRIRKLVAAAFTPRSVEALHGPCAELAHELLPDGRFDLLRDFGQPYSIAVICKLLGVPTDRGRDLLDWSHTMVKMYELDTTLAQAEAATQAAAEFRDYVLHVVGERRREPQDDLVTRLVEVEVEGRRLTDAELVSTIIVLLNAGHEATVNTLGNGVLALMRHPAQWECLVDGSVAPVAALEELMRYDPPLQLFERWVLEDGVEIAGEPVPRGEKVALLFGSANRDPRVFADPDDFDVTRENAAATSFRIRVCSGGSSQSRLQRSLSQKACQRGSSGSAAANSSSEPMWRKLRPRRRSRRQARTSAWRVTNQRSRRSS